MGRWWSAVACAGILACVALSACNQAATPVAKKSAPSSGPIATNLPDGVCAPTYQQFSDPKATRIEAKLVTIATLSTSDPNFPPGWKSPPRSAYFWVVAEVGTFIVKPHVPTNANPTPSTFHTALSYIQANTDPSDPETLVNPCRSIGGSLTDGPWPAWFDDMSALADIKVR